MACRDVEKANAAKKDIEEKAAKDAVVGELLVEKLDLSSFTSVREFANRMLANEQHIDILVNNAGVMMCPQGKTEDGFETHIGTNHLSHALLTLLLLPRLKSSGASRIVNVSSYLHARKFIFILY
jgi:retinol dehydrogenase 12